MPRIVQTARDKSHEMYLRDRLVKINSLRQEQVSNPDRFHKKPQSNRRSIFKKQRRPDECIWLRQEILEPANEDSARHRRCERVSVPAVAAKNKKIALNPSGRFHRISLKHKRNV